MNIPSINIAHDPLPSIGFPGPAETGIEDLVVNSVFWIKLGVEAIGVLVIGLGVAIAVVQLIRLWFSPQPKDYNEIRLTLARHLALALAFQLRADILSTAVAPNWDQIGKLGAIAVIRTALNYFLMRELQETHAHESERPDARTNLMTCSTPLWLPAKFPRRKPMPTMAVRCGVWRYWPRSSARPKPKSKPPSTRLLPMSRRSPGLAPCSGYISH
ncbi:MAG: DUF1622 domain-containing protein [Candidatus Competibacteraceae bacterium]|nr:DUF1622 domain-containing protein [Candidatus Competibacteraceae bacterium]MCB1820101.1 DUF1622 domain-containing protein [Candidatus Competibacteraceae bacterium]HRY15274.1 DUF1622 domain-containing protein [Candidatus Competibacteraceae bacterium]